jgi:hypothetical protein
MPESTSNYLLKDLQANGFPVAMVQPWGESWNVDFTGEATEDQQIAAWDFIRNWQPPALPDWGSFRLALLSNPAYQRSTLAVSGKTQGILLVQRLENAAAMAEPPIAVIVMLWNGVINSLPKEMPIATEEVKEWQAIATATNVPLSFTDNGSMNADS